MIYKKVLLDNIESEKKGKSFKMSTEDRAKFNSMLTEINERLKLNLSYFSEFIALDVSGSSDILLKYLSTFNSEYVKSELIRKISVEKEPNNCDVIFDSYLHFKSTTEYFCSKPGDSNAIIFVNYDNAFKRIKPKRISEKLLSLIENPIDAFYLPLTMKMLASWRIPELKKVLFSYLECGREIDRIFAVYLKENFESRITYIKRNLKFTAISALCNYPEKAVYDVLLKNIPKNDSDIKEAISKSLEKIESKII